MSVSVTAHSLTEMVERYGEERLTKFLQTFSCPKNPEVERFLKDKAISSAKLSASQTYVVTEDATGLIVGYYTLVLKAYTVNGLFREFKVNFKAVLRFFRFHIGDKQFVFLFNPFAHLAQASDIAFCPKSVFVWGNIEKHKGVVSCRVVVNLQKMIE